MNIALNITVSKHDKHLLLASGIKSISDGIRTIVSTTTLNNDDIKERLSSDRLTCNLDLDTAMKIQKIADEIGEPATRVARAMIEKYLHEDIKAQMNPDDMH